MAVLSRGTYSGSKSYDCEMHNARCFKFKSQPVLFNSLEHF